MYLTFVQGAERQKTQQESQAARLADMELMLSALAAKTEVHTADSLFVLYKHPVKRLNCKVCKISMSMTCAVGGAAAI